MLERKMSPVAPVTGDRSRRILLIDLVGVDSDPIYHDHLIIVGDPDPEPGRHYLSSEFPGFGVCLWCGDPANQGGRS
jgi:hypothetical protein